MKKYPRTYLLFTLGSKLKVFSWKPVSINVVYTLHFPHICAKNFCAIFHILTSHLLTSTYVQKHFYNPFLKIYSPLNCHTCMVFQMIWIHKFKIINFNCTFLGEMKYIHEIHLVETTDICNNFGNCHHKLKVTN